MMVSGTNAGTTIHDTVPRASYPLRPTSLGIMGRLARGPKPGRRRATARTAWRAVQNLPASVCLVAVVAKPGAIRRRPEVETFSDDQIFQGCPTCGIEKRKKFVFFPIPGSDSYWKLAGKMTNHKGNRIPAWDEEGDKDRGKRPRNGRRHDTFKVDPPSESLLHYKGTSSHSCAPPSSLATLKEPLPNP